MFDPILKERNGSMTYTTPVSFRVMFAVVTMVVFLTVALVPDRPFLSRFGVVPLVLIGLCVLGTLYLDRWTFDKTTNLFRQDVGLLVLHASRRRPLDTLSKVVLIERGAAATDRRTVGLSARSRGTALLTVVDRDGRTFRLGMARGGGTRVLQVYAERLAGFCAIPLERPGRLPQ